MRKKILLSLLIVLSLFTVACDKENNANESNKVMGEALKEYDNHPPVSAFHDRWMYLICHFLGNVFYDDCSLFGYRIHEANVIGTKVKEDDLKKDFRKLHRKKININKLVIEEFVDNWSLRIKPKDMNNINVYFSYSDSCISKLKLLLLPTFGPKEISYRGIIGHAFRICRNEL